jgi:hypothetical protein
MWWAWPSALLVLAVSPALSGDARPAPPRAGLSWADSESLSRKLASIEARQKAKTRKKETVVVTEGELNSYLNLAYGPELPRGVSDLDARLDYERIRVTGIVDLDLVQGKVSAPSPLSPLNFLRGRVPVELAGRLVNRDGFGNIEWETVRISSIPLPITMLEQMVVSSTRNSRNPEGVDIHAPFRLPYSVDRVRLEPGRAYLDF